MIRDGDNNQNMSTCPTCVENQFTARDAAIKMKIPATENNAFLPPLFHRADEQDQRGRDTPQLTPCAYDMPCMEIGNADPGRFYEPWPEIR